MIRKGTFLYNLMALPGRVLIGVFERLIILASGNATFFPTDPPWVKTIEADWMKIRAELDALVEKLEENVPEFKDISEEQARITLGTWRTHIFYIYGQRVEANCQACPETVRLLNQIPGMTTGLFSMLTPGSGLAPHRGPFKGVLRYHLGLRVPDPLACGIRVGKDVEHWYEGKSLIFDDTHEHEVWNRTDKLRAVLFVDYIRPLPFPLSVLNLGMIKLISVSPFIRNMVTNLNNRVSDVDRA